MGKILSNRRRYLGSLAEELYVQATRVRDLIGDAHWLSDGHHKEYLLIDLLKRHLPNGLLASRGFVISPTDGESRSTEQDILVVETQYEAPVFHQGGLIIVFPSSVRAAVSVKTTLDIDSVKDSIKGLSSVRNTACGLSDPRSIWCGAFYFSACEAVLKNPLLPYKYIRDGMAVSPVAPGVLPPRHPIPLGPDLHCSAKDLIFKLDHGYNSDENTTVPPRLLGYRCGGFATAFFLGQLLDHAATARDFTGLEFSTFAEAGDIEELGPSQNVV
jgi:hypothetical protein